MVDDFVTVEAGQKVIYQDVGENFYIIPEITRKAALNTTVCNNGSIGMN